MGEELAEWWKSDGIVDMCMKLKPGTHSRRTLPTVLSRELGNGVGGQQSSGGRRKLLFRKVAVFTEGS